MCECGISGADSSGGLLRAQKVVYDEIRKKVEESSTAHCKQILSHLTHTKPGISKCTTARVDLVPGLGLVVINLKLPELCWMSNHPHSHPATVLEVNLADVVFVAAFDIKRFKSEFLEKRQIR